VLEAQRADILERFRAGSSALVTKVWDSKFRDAVFPESQATAQLIGARVARDLGDKRANFDPEVMDAWLLANAAAGAEWYNLSTTAQLEAALDEAESDESEVEPIEAVETVLALAVTSRLLRFAQGSVATVANFGGNEAARANGAMAKQWKVNSSNPRSSHARMRGEMVEFDQTFSNRLRWPGDHKGDPDETAGCKCTVVFVS